MQKSQTIQQKLSIKMNLRDHSNIKHKKFIQYDEEQEEKQMYDFSLIQRIQIKKWWLRVNKKYFARITRHELDCLKNTIMEDYYLPVQGIPLKQQSYFCRSIQSKNPRMFDRKNIRVLFQYTHSQECQSDIVLLSYCFNTKHNQGQQSSYNSQISSNGHSSYPQPQSQQYPVKFPSNVAITYLKQTEETANKMRDMLKEELLQDIEELQLNMIKSSEDVDLITQCNYFDLINQCYFKTELDRQINLWQEQYKKVKSLNDLSWSTIYRNLQKQMEQEDETLMIKNIKNGYNPDEDMDQIQKYLKWQHNLVNFKYGFGEKNLEMLADALEGMWIKQNKAKDMGEKRKFFKASIQNLMITRSELNNVFETDCKICFSTYVSEKNKVIYCDKCNQSFHEQCYGIQNLDEDPQSKYYCDPCSDAQQSKSQSKKSKKCEICCLKGFPLKRFQKHYFHPSCLFLNNMLKAKLGNLELADNLDTATIRQSVKTFQKRYPTADCEYCTETCELGFRFKCAESNCDKYFHSICAYLNAACFNIWREDERLKVQIRCREHFPERDWIRQMYLRRFFCNYKNVANLSENELVQIYREQIEQIREYKEQKKIKAGKFRKDIVSVEYEMRRKNEQLQRSTSNYIQIQQSDFSCDDFQNTQYFQNDCHFFNSNQIKSRHHMASNSPYAVSANSLKSDFEKMSVHYAKKKTKQSDSLEAISLKQLNSFLINLNSDQFEDNQSNSLKTDNYSEEELNNNSNESKGHFKKTTLS